MATNVNKARAELDRAKRKLQDAEDNLKNAEAKAAIEYAYVEATVTFVYRIPTRDHTGELLSEQMLKHLGWDWFDKNNVNSLNKFDPDSDLMSYDLGSAKIVQDKGDWN